MKFSGCLFAIYLFASPIINVFGQCPAISVDFDDEVCAENDQIFTNMSSTGLGYAWDYSLNDFDAVPELSSLGQFNQFDRTDALASLIFKNNHLLFVPIFSSGGSSKLFRMDFGDNFHNTPTVTDLGNPSGLLSDIYDLKFIVVMDIVYGLALKSTGNLVLLKFPNGPSDNTIVTFDLGNVTESNNAFSLEVILHQSTPYAFITTRGEKSLRILKFENGLENPFLIDKVLLPSSGVISGVSIYQDCNNVIALVSSTNAQKLFKVTLDPLDLLNVTNAVINEITFPFTDVVRLWNVRHGNSLTFVSLTKDGKLIEIDFGKDFSDNTNPIITVKNAYPISNLNGQAFANNLSELLLFSIDFSSSVINLLEYPNTSNSTPIGDNSYSSSVIYSTDGWKYFHVRALDSLSGSVDYLYDSVFVHSLPVSDFSFDKACFMEETLFYDESSSPSSEITSWFWDFAGLGSSSIQNPEFSFPAAGTYSVSLRVFDANGCEHISVYPVKIYENDDIDPLFSNPSLICTNTSIQFIDESTFIEDEIVGWNWDFNNEGISNDQDPQFIFTDEGLKTIYLTVTGLSGCEYTVFNDIIVSEGPATAFTFENVCFGNAIQFTDQSSGTSPIIAWLWDFDDTNTSSDPSPAHTYLAPGTYEVTLTTTNQLGCSTFDTQTVTVHSNPVAAFTNEFACARAETFFTDASSVDNANISSWEWDFGDGATSTDQNPQHIFSNEGTYPVKLKVVSNFGCSDSTTIIVEALISADVLFSFDKACFGDPTQFVNETTTDSTNPITSTTWVIDGKIFTELEPAYEFPLQGNYTVSLTVATENQCLVTYQQDVQVNPYPTAAYGYTQACNSGPVTFFDSTQPFDGDPIVSRSWKINGVEFGIDSTASVVPDETGDNLVSLTIMTANGCAADVQKSVNVLESPIAGFEVPTSVGAYPLQLDFLNTSEAGSSFSWKFDSDTVQSEEENPSHVFTTVGDYEVELITTNELGCSDTTIHMISAVEPEYEVLLKQLIPRDDNGRTQLILDIENPGTVTLDESNLEIQITLGTDVTITEPFDEVLYAFQSTNYVLNFTLDADSKNTLSFLCVELVPLSSNTSTSNKTACLTFATEPIFINPYPNPIVDMVNVGVVAPVASPIFLTWMDSSGRIFFQQEITDTNEGYNLISFDASIYYAGTYYLTVRVQDSFQTFKVVRI